MSSYHRKCKHCGRTIQMRQMPHGQWVAFEGYDTPHDCSKPIPRDNNPKSLPLFESPRSGNEEFGDYRDLEFPDISIPGQGSQEKDEPLAAILEEVRPFPSSQQEKTPLTRSKQGYIVHKKRKSIPSWFWWIIFWLGIPLLLFLIGMLD
jgi:hypothetical protein